MQKLIGLLVMVLVMSTSTVVTANEWGKTIELSVGESSVIAQKGIHEFTYLGKPSLDSFAIQANMPLFFPVEATEIVIWEYRFKVIEVNSTKITLRRFPGK